MKLNILAPTSGHHIAQNETIDIIVRATHDDGAVAPNFSLTWRPAARRGRWAQRITKTDKTGTARNSLTFPCDAKPGAYRIEVGTPDQQTHLIGTIHVRPDNIAMFAPKRTETAPAANDGTLTIVYPPESVLLPVNSPIKVWALYTNSSGGGYGNQPIQFTPGANTSFVGTPDTQTDADGWATATVELSKAGTLGTVATFDGSVTAAITNANVSASRPLHASTSAGGPGTIKVTRLEYTPNLANPVVANKVWNRIEFQHLLADGTAGKYAYVATEPVLDNTAPVLDPAPDTYFLEPDLRADSLGTIENFIFTTLQQGDTITNTNVDVSAPNVIAGVDDPLTLAKPILVGNYNGSLGTGTIEVGPLGQGSTDTLPIGERIQFRAVCRNADGTPVPSNTSVSWAPQTRAQFGIDPGLSTTTNSDGEAFLWLTVSKAYEPCYTMALEVSASDRIGYIQGLWTGIFYDQDNPPFPQMAVNITPPEDPDVPFGQTMTLQATVLTGRDWLTGLPTTPAPNQTVYWHADPAEKVAFSLALGPVSTLPHDEFPTVTDTSGNTSVRVSGIGGDAFSATIWAEVHNRDTGTLIDSDPPITLEFGAEQKPQIVVHVYPATAPLYASQAAVSAAYSGPADQQPPQLEWFVDAGADKNHFFTFTPNPSTMREGGSFSNITGYGANEDISVKIYARPLEAPGVPTPTDFTLVPAQMTFTHVSQVPPGTVLNAVSLDGDPLSLEALHLVTASFTNLDGTPVASGSGDSEWDGNIHWSPLPQQDPNLSWLSTDPTPADANGIATNGVECSADLHQVTLTATASANNGSLLATSTLPLTFQQNVRLEDQGQITVRSDDGDQLQLNTPFPVSAIYRDSQNNLVPDNTWVTWNSFPANRVAFLDGEKTQTTSGVARNHIQASGQSEIPAAYVSATSPNALTGANDYGLSPSINFEAQVDALIIEPKEVQPLTLYDPHELDASYTGSKTLQSVAWSVDPNENPRNIIAFNPNPSQATKQGNTYTTSTQITVDGPNTPVGVTVYARSTDTNPSNFVAGDTDQPLAFKAKAQIPTGKIISVTSLDGNPLSEGANVWHLLQATYTNIDGTPISGATLNWSPANQAGVILVPRPKTDANGVATAAINVTSAMGVTVTASDNSNTSGSLSLTFQAGTVTLPGQGAMALTSDDTQPLSLDDKHGLTVIYYANSDKKTFVPDGTEVTWHAFPPDRLTFDSPTTQVTGGKGVATNNVTASGDTPITNAVISTTNFNGDTGVNDHSDPDLVVDFQASDALIIKPKEVPPLTLYDPHELDATYIGTKTLQKVRWSVDLNENPHNTITFSPNPSTATKTGNTYTTKTNITVNGPNQPVNVTVHGRSTDTSSSNFIAGKTDPAVAFKQIQGQPPAGKIIAVTSLDGNPLSEGTNVWHLLQATYTNIDGTPISGVTLTWTPANQAGVTIVPGQPTDSNGVATASINVTSVMDVTVTATDNNDTNKPSGSAPLNFTAPPPVQMPGQGLMVFAPVNSPLPLQTSEPLSVTYTDGNGNFVPDGTDVTWHGFPPDRLTFDSPTTQVTGGQGIATNNVTASGDTSISGAVISTSHFNAEIGANDHSDPDLVVDFQAKPKTNLLGVLIDKAYAQNPTQYVDPTEPNQIIKCQVQVLNQQGAQQVTLLTTPSNALETIFDTSGKELTRDSNYNYVLTTNASGVGTFLIGSENFTMFDLNAQWNQQTLAVPTKLVLATNMQQRSAVMTAPSVPGVTNGGTLQIPTARPAPTFKVTVPSRYITTGTQVAVLLNNRLVYNGVADPALNTGVDVAYAALNLTGNNNLVYVTPTFQESKQFTFLASGTPQTGPDTGGAQRTLNPPQVGIKSGQTIGPKDIINGGLPVVLDAYDSVAVNDVVTMFFYLSGTDVLTAKPVTNIVPVVYQVLSDSPLLSGQPVNLPLPQQYAAGYANGKIQVDYNVVNQTSTRWSQLTSAYALNTTF